MAIKKDTLDGLLAGAMTRRLFSPRTGYSTSSKKAFGGARFERGVIDDHLDGEAAAGKRNSRNG